MLSGKKLKLTLKNDLAEISRLGEIIEEYAQLNKLDTKTIFDINLVLEEVVTNIISYGYQESSNEENVEITFDLQADRLVITVRDNASPFNPLELPEPDTALSLEERGIGGLGIHLVRNKTDHQEYRREGNSNVLVMTKNIKC